MDISGIRRFGIEEEYSSDFGTAIINSIIQINKRELLICTTKRIIRYDSGTVKATYPYILSTAVAIPETDLIVGITSKSFEFIVFLLSEMEKPLVSGYPTNHVGAFHLLYSPKSRSLISIGSGVKVWKLEITGLARQVSVYRPTVNLVYKCAFANFYETVIINPPSFDYERELLLLPTPSGICPFTLTGEQGNPISRFPATSTTIFSFDGGSTRLLSADPTEGLCLWREKVGFRKSYPSANTSIFMLAFVDSENAVYLNAHRSFSILNIKTSRVFPCFNVKSTPNRISVFRGEKIYIAAAFGPKIIVLKVNIPWKAWITNIPRPVHVSRVSKIGSAARILVLFANGFVKLYSPKTGRLMTTAFSDSPLSILYDRGNFLSIMRVNHRNRVKVTETVSRDQLFAISGKGVINGFNTGVHPCELLLSISHKASLIQPCIFESQWHYAVVSSSVDILICDYISFVQKKRISVSANPIMCMFYDIDGGVLIVCCERETLLLDVDRGAVVSRGQFKPGVVNEMCLGMVFSGYKNGDIARIDVRNREVQDKDIERSRRAHDGAVTAISFGVEFWVSTGEDGTAIIWDYDFFKINVVVFPIPLFACAVRNGNRDVIVATDSELMIIEFPHEMFSTQIDEEVKEIDNFDKLDDELKSSWLNNDEEDNREEWEFPRLQDSEEKTKRIASPKKNGRGQYVQQSSQDSKSSGETAIKEDSLTRGRFLAEMMELNTNEIASIEHNLMTEFEDTENNSELNKDEENDDESNEHTGEDKEEDNASGRTPAKKVKKKKLKKDKHENTTSDQSAENTHSESNAGHEEDTSVDAHSNNNLNNGKEETESNNKEHVNGDDSGIPSGNNKTGNRSKRPFVVRFETRDLNNNQNSNVEEETKSSLEDGLNNVDISARGERVNARALRGKRGRKNRVQGSTRRKNAPRFKSRIGYIEKNVKVNEANSMKSRSITYDEPKQHSFIRTKINVLIKEREPVKINWRYVYVRQRRKIIPRTVRVRKTERRFVMPPPNIVIDPQSLLRLYGRTLESAKRLTTPADPIPDLPEDERDQSEFLDALLQESLKPVERSSVVVVVSPPHTKPKNVPSPRRLSSPLFLTTSPSQKQTPLPSSVTYSLGSPVSRSVGSPIAKQPQTDKLLQRMSFDVAAKNDSPARYTISQTPNRRYMDYSIGKRGISLVLPKAQRYSTPVRPRPSPILGFPEDGYELTGKCIKSP